MKLKNHKISFCTVCMNRLHHLKQTLLTNIADNEDYPELEFVILDYNAVDGLENWMKENVDSFIRSGRVVYYKTTDPRPFTHSHTKNIVFRLCKGQIICNINADHYTGKKFARFVNDCFSKEPRIVITTIDFFNSRSNYSLPNDVLGKVCVTKYDFININGFDENIVNYGYEDSDLVNRLEMSGLKRLLLENFTFLRYIEHGIEERFPHNKVLAKIHSIYISYCSPYKSKVMYLYNSNLFQIGTLIDNFAKDSSAISSSYSKKVYRYNIEREESTWDEGKWYEQLDSNTFTLSFFSGRLLTFDKQNDESLSSSNGEYFRFYKMTDENIIYQLTIFNYILDSSSKMEHNLENRTIKVNSNGFPPCSLFKNFDTVNTIEI